MARQQFLNSPDDVEWVREKMSDIFGEAVERVSFRSFVLHGNEDAPTYIAFYELKDPKVSDDVVAEFFDEDGTQKFVSDKHDIHETADDEDGDDTDYGDDEDDEE